MASPNPLLASMGRVGGLLRANEPDLAAIAEARTELTTTRCEVAIRKAIAAEFPPTVAQRKRLAVLLLAAK